jgi:hypothetical protein
MKKLCIALLGLLIAVIAPATNVTVDLKDARLDVGDYARRTLWLYRMGGHGITNASIIGTTGTILIATNNASGVYTYTNLFPGVYMVVVKAPPREERFSFWVVSSDLGNINAADYLLASAGSTYPTGDYAYSAAVTDSRYARSAGQDVSGAQVTNALGFIPQPSAINLTNWALLSTNALENVSSNQAYLATNSIPINPLGFAPTNSVILISSNEARLATNIFGSNPYSYTPTNSAILIASNECYLATNIFGSNPYHYAPSNSVVLISSNQSWLATNIFGSNPYFYAPSNSVLLISSNQSRIATNSLMSSWSLVPTNSSILIASNEVWLATNSIASDWQLTPTNSSILIASNQARIATNSYPIKAISFGAGLYAETNNRIISVTAAANVVTNTGTGYTLGGTFSGTHSGPGGGIVSAAGYYLADTNFVATNLYSRKNIYGSLSPSNFPVIAGQNVTVTTNVTSYTISVPGIVLNYTTNNNGNATNLTLWGSASAQSLFANNLSGYGTNILSLDASKLSKGYVPVARMGSGTPAIQKFLRGDGSWAYVEADGSGITNNQYLPGVPIADASGFTNLTSINLQFGLVPSSDTNILFYIDQTASPGITGPYTWNPTEQAFIFEDNGIYWEPTLGGDLGYSYAYVLTNSTAHDPANGDIVAFFGYKPPITEVRRSWDWWDADYNVVGITAWATNQIQESLLSVVNTSLTNRGINLNYPITFAEGALANTRRQNMSYEERLMVQTILGNLTWTYGEGDFVGQEYYVPAASYSENPLEQELWIQSCPWIVGVNQLSNLVERIWAKKNGSGQPCLVLGLTGEPTANSYLKHAGAAPAVTTLFYRHYKKFGSPALFSRWRTESEAHWTSYIPLVNHLVNLGANDYGEYMRDALDARGWAYELAGSVRYFEALLQRAEMYAALGDYTSAAADVAEAEACRTAALTHLWDNTYKMYKAYSSQSWYDVPFNARAVNDGFAPQQQAFFIVSNLVAMLPGGALVGTRHISNFGAIRWLPSDQNAGNGEWVDNYAYLWFIPWVCNAVASQRRDIADSLYDDAVLTLLVDSSAPHEKYSFGGGTRNALGAGQAHYGQSVTALLGYDRYRGRNPY